MSAGGICLRSFSSKEGSVSTSRMATEGEVVGKLAAMAGAAMLLPAIRRAAPRS